MTYSINTSKYTTTKAVSIDGVSFKVRPFTTAEQMAMTDLQSNVSKLDKDNPSLEPVKEIVDKILEAYVALFDKEVEARKILAKIPMEKYSEIYNDIMENAPDATTKD